MNGYQEHLNVLANDIGCDLRQFDRDTPGMMYVEFGYVEGPKIEGPYPPSSRYVSAQQQYVVNLHELGHFVHGHTQGRPPKDAEKFYFENGVLHSEAQAWEFAIEHMIDPILLSTYHFMWNTCLGSYYRAARARGYKLGGNQLWNGNRHHVRFTWDRPSELFKDIAKRLQEGCLERAGYAEG